MASFFITLLCQKSPPRCVINNDAKNYDEVSDDISNDGPEDTDRLADVELEDADDPGWAR